MSKKLIGLAVLIMSLYFSFLTPSFAVQQLDHPYFQSEDYRKNSEELKSSEAEIQRLNSKLNDLQQERTQYSSLGVGFLQFLTALPFFSLNTIILSCLASLVGIFIYIRYLKAFNPAKYFILFKSKGNISMLLKSIKEFNKFTIILVMGIMLLPGVCRAQTDIVTDSRYFLFGNDIERGYVYVKYPKKGRVPAYTEIEGVKLYPQGDSGSFERSFNLLVHEKALGFPIVSRDLLEIIGKSRSFENLEGVYTFVFKFDDVTVKEVVQKRMAGLPTTRGEVRYVEPDTVLKAASATNRRGLVVEDIAAALNQMLPDATGTADILELSYLFSDIDRTKSTDLFGRVKYRFKEIVSSDVLKSKFNRAYVALSKTKSTEPLYVPVEVMSQLGDESGLAVRVARLFDSLNEDLSRSITKSFSLEKYRYLNQPEFQDLGYLLNKYRSEDLTELLMRLTMDYLKTSTKDLRGYMRFTAILGFDNSAAVAALVKQDEALYGAKAENSSLVTQEFLDLLSGDDLSRHFEYLKTRTPQAQLILKALFDKRYDLFGDYLEFSYNKDPRLLERQSFPNKLVAFSKWNEILPESAISGFSIPFGFYLADKELSKPSPDIVKVKPWLVERRDGLFSTIIASDAKLNDDELVSALVLYYLYSRAKDSDLNISAKILEEVIGQQTKERVEKRLASIGSRVKEIRQRVQTTSSEVEEVKRTARSAKIRVVIASFLTIVIGIYLMITFFYSIKFASNAVASYSTARVGLFALVFLETYAKFLVPIPYFTIESLFIIIAIHLYGFMRSRDTEYPNVVRAVAHYRNHLEEPLGDVKVVNPVPSSKPA